MPDRAVMAALASPKRPQVLVIAARLGVAQPTATAHMQAPALPR
jgi:hypothetical protein